MIQEAQAGQMPLLGCYAKAWRIYSRATGQIDAVCRYLNKVIEKLADVQPDKVTIVMVNGERMEVRLKPISILGLHIWKKAVLVYSRERLGNILVHEILDAITLERTETQMAVSREDLGATIRSFSDCDPREHVSPLSVPFSEERAMVEERPVTLYEADLETLYVAMTREFYFNESNTKIANEPITGYIHYAEKRLREEIQRAKTLFPISSSSKIIATVEAQLITAHRDCLQRDFKQLLTGGHTADLNVVFGLLKRIPDGLQPLSDCFEAFVIQEGLQCLERLASLFHSDGTATCEDSTLVALRVPGCYVHLLGDLHRSYKRLVAGCFESDARFNDCIQNAFREIINRTVPCMRMDTGKLLADFFDLLMRDEITPPEKEQPNRPADKIFMDFTTDGVSLLNFVPDKESFCQHYVYHLARRLLFRLSHHGQVETILVGHLKAACGYEMGNKLLKMFNDIAASHDMFVPFSRHLLDHSVALPFEMQVNVITAVIWPVQMPDPDDLSFRGTPQMENGCKLFESFYLSRRNGRKLIWLHHMSRVHMQHAGSEGRVYDVQMTIPQMHILTGFQDSDSCRAQDLMERCGAGWKEFSHLIKPMLNIHLLMWDVKEDEIPNQSNSLLYNPSFSYPRSRVKLALPALEPTVVEEEERERGKEEQALSCSKSIDNRTFLAGEESAPSLSDSHRYALQALIVRLLKESRELSAARLLQLVCERAARPGPHSFEPNAHHIRLCLDQLIEKQYIEHDPKRGLFSYLA